MGAVLDTRRWLGGQVASSTAMPVTVTLPDGKALELKDGATGADAAAAIGPGLARAALAVEVSLPRQGAAGDGEKTGASAG
ncbi:MAG: TGS domain-containing protein, partial [Solirubrobacterales bacterium]